MFTRSLFFRAGLILIVALALAGCYVDFGFNAVTAEERGSQTVDAPTAPRVVVESFNGEIEVRAGSEGEVEADWVKRGSGDSQAAAQDDLNNVEVTVTREGDAVRIIARRTDSRPANNSGASFEVRVPANAVLDLRTSNGGITVDGITGEVRADTSNGKVRVDGATGRVDLSSSNGEIDVTATNAAVTVRTSNGAIRFEGSLADGDHTFSTSNGRIVLTLPSDARFRVDARTSNGEVMTDFPVTVSGKIEKDALNGTVGENPAVSLRLESSNGSIEIRKGQ